MFLFLPLTDWVRKSCSADGRWVIENANCGSEVPVRSSRRNDLKEQMVEEVDDLGQSANREV